MTGNRYIITLVDYFSKWPEAKATADKTAVTVAAFLFETFSRHAWPEVIISDQGREFVNGITERLFEVTGTEHRISSPYHPQTNGLVERFNQTLVGGLRKVVDANKDDWDTKLNSVLYAYRISKQASSNYSPYFLLFNRHPRTALSLSMEPAMTDLHQQCCDINSDFDTILDSALEVRQKYLDDARKNIADAQARQTLQYNRKHQSLKVTTVFGWC